MQFGSRSTWLAIAASFLLVPLMFMAAHWLTPAPAEVQPAAAVDLARFQGLVKEANGAADASYAESEVDCREYLRALRGEPRLQAFVGELISLEQKVQLGGDWWNSANSRDRIEQLFIDQVANGQQVSQKLRKVAYDYQISLCAYDYILLTTAGFDEEAVLQALTPLEKKIPSWDGMFARAIDTAVAETQTDVARTVAVVGASNFLGDGLRKGGREMNLYTAEEGSVADLLGQLIIDAGVTAVVEHFVDPTDEIVSSLSEELARTEAEVLHGPDGLLPLLNEMKDAHEAARRTWFFPPTTP